MDTNSVINILAFAILTLLWLGFLAALIFNPGLLHIAWWSFRRMPLLAQIVVALFTLPVTLGLCIWHVSWPAWLRLVLVAGLAWFTVYTFFPKLPLA